MVRHVLRDASVARFPPLPSPWVVYSEPEYAQPGRTAYAMSQVAYPLYCLRRPSLATFHHLSTVHRNVIPETRTSLESANALIAHCEVKLVQGQREEAGNGLAGLGRSKHPYLPSTVSVVAASPRGLADIRSATSNSSKNCDPDA